MWRWTHNTEDTLVMRVHEGGDWYPSQEFFFVFFWVGHDVTDTRDLLYDDEKITTILSVITDVSHGEIVGRLCDSSDEEVVDLGTAVRTELISHDSGDIIQFNMYNKRPHASVIYKSIIDLC